MKFTLYNKQTAVRIDEPLWHRAFAYASSKLQIENHRASVACLFIPLDMERDIKFKVFALGQTELTEDGAIFYVVTAPHDHEMQMVEFVAPETAFRDRKPHQGRMVKTFFHEITHVKQLLMGELIAKPRARNIIWKKEKWHWKEYAFAPWEMEANAFSEMAYDQFLRLEVSRIMADEDVHAYHPSVLQLRHVFPQEDVFRLTQELSQKREQRITDEMMVG